MARVVTTVKNVIRREDLGVLGRTRKLCHSSPPSTSKMNCSGVASESLLLKSRLISLKICTVLHCHTLIPPMTFPRCAVSNSYRMHFPILQTSNSPCQSLAKNNIAYYKFLKHSQILAPSVILPFEMIVYWTICSQVINAVWSKTYEEVIVKMLSSSYNG